ncbi:Asp-tRNA(Asn)/Glu-tRNA(Gln) amidotransferase GatCAB subunit C [Candidatus Falkowbacteria bacterium HGW-Falkowbacteria-2]|uniref:Asp-tRNA(Asn)/Glu-tRNA(Gln) amidotransferase GatCAB subunit C n=1 Tax=Candidatus Falkowbacteria bacterium HGW-Falkowbacteria-2 TaxID=2013769 RepID=A0A2N2E3N9_9BACT|nr:MAG: Asp-tRNA(Asn)/Glu-tRNA(Gln) amidotransferase GatCAB subunit C [Candidatus Falkowbacteria bacterium HGW-Falkowbacteria-2]
MKFEKKDIEHIANLARLELTSDELKTYGEQLSAITAYIDQLQNAPTGEVIADAPLHNIWREDEALDWSEEERERALSQGEREGGLVKVKRVL